MKATTTKRVYKEDTPTLARWMKKLKIKSFPELIHRWINEVDLKVHENFYNQLTSRTNYQKPLSGCKIDKSKICIQKNSAVYG